ncbi:hypothetical protein BKH42_02565 [Helicobacter sp. 13S00482-2]|uniref:HP0838 family lipoprotein n=1 Tax=Helicobacter sp. 13S00482-2 TaxID=1476200 RepID=UPI000BA7ACA0|nr:hypothetical protein [Helicobacter sp. 13S00482-2]PAF54113.1 hypothetical protein BKH42_02565 [Helicobacter sp. 13S00482-2]
MCLHKTFTDKIPQIFLGVFVCLFLTSCTSLQNFFLPKDPGEKTSKKSQNIKQTPTFKLVYIKTAMFRFYDYGILDIGPKEIKLELFKLGKSMGSILVKRKQICLLSDCAPKWPAAKNFFGKVSYGDLFDDILLSKDIFDGIGKQITPDGGVIQRFQKSGEVFFYERKPGHILFRNMSTGVTISIDDYVDPSLQTQSP